VINKVHLIRFDSQSGAWTDGTNFVKGQLIRRYALEHLGRKSQRGRLSRKEISDYWLDRFGVSADVA
jgi:hypothetical protein